jgi:hypothetical protein
MVLRREAEDPLRALFVRFQSEFPQDKMAETHTPDLLITNAHVIDPSATDPGPATRDLLLRDGRIHAVAQKEVTGLRFPTSSTPPALSLLPA